MKRLLTALFAFSFVLAAACGQSGPLYIPGDPSRIENPPPPQDETAEEEKEEDGDGR